MRLAVESDIRIRKVIGIFIKYFNFNDSCCCLFNLRGSNKSSRELNTTVKFFIFLTVEC